MGVVAQVQRWPAGEQDRPQHRLEAVGVHVRARQRGDHLSHSIRLLGGDATLLDRELRDVARGVDVRQPVDPAAQVRGDEAARVLREPEDPRALEAGQRDHAVRDERGRRGELERAAVETNRVAARVQLDSALAQERSHGLARRRAEQ